MHAAFLNSFTDLTQWGVETTFSASVSRYCSVLQQMEKMRKNFLHPTSDSIRAGSWQETVLTAILEENWHIKRQKSHLTDAKEENFQGDSKGLEEDQTADDFLPNESQISCEIKSNKELLAQTASAFFPYTAGYCWSQYCTLHISVHIIALGTATAAVSYLVLLLWMWNFWLF